MSVSPNKKKRKYPFYISITVLAVALVVGLTAIFLWVSHKESSVAAIQTADRLFNEVNDKAVQLYQDALGAVAGFAGAAALMPGMTETPSEDGLSHPGLPLMVQALKYYTYVFSVYAGYSDASFIQVIATRDDPQILSQYSAPEGTQFIVRSINPDDMGNRRQYWRFLDADLAVVGQGETTAPDFDPRRRPWYTRALKSSQAVYTNPYIFNFMKIPGITCAEQLFDGSGVFGVDITLERFAQSLKKNKVSPNGALFLFNRQGNLLAHSEERLDEAAIVKARHQKDKTLRFIKGAEVDDLVMQAIFTAEGKQGFSYGQTEQIAIGGRPYLVRLSTMNPDLEFQELIGSVAPLSDFTGHIRRMQYRTSLYAFIVLLVVIPAVLWGGRRLSGSLVRLGKMADKVRQFDFSPSEPFDSVIKEIHSLIRAFDLMQLTIRQRTEALIATQKKLEKLVQSGIALSAEQDMDKLLELIFHAAQELSNTDGGVLYLRDKENQLQFEIMQTSSGGILRNDELKVNESFKMVSLYDPDSGAENHAQLESHVALTGQTLVIQDGEPAEGFDAADTCMLDENLGGPCASFLTVPLKPREEETIGVLQLVNARDADTGQLGKFNAEIVEFVEALAAQAAMALHNKALLEAQRNLFNAMIQLLAGAIDAKSPYTGGHCARVPEIAMLLAKAANDDTQGPFEAFHFHTEDQWHEFKVAAWLHDCGKVTTPEYVVDKATKLETIYNRIHEIRTRFEVIWRDAEIAYYRDLLEGKKERQALQRELSTLQAQLQEDFAFVAECNEGGEFMADEKIERLKTIAARKWVRHFDDHLGLSQEEFQRKSQLPSQSLPVEETLLADKAEHILSRGGVDPFNGNPHSFKMDIPEHLYNLGELYNLCIRKGTLTDEERFKINEHIIQTVLMLKKLPFPKYLLQVPDVAASHHETMIGTGYPRKLTREDMSIPARIMAIADIFEALTASDRPYKKAKTLSESLRIMSFMRNDQHIDAELFDLFLTSGAYQAYADEFLDPSQIDEVDIHNYLTSSLDS